MPSNDDPKKSENLNKEDRFALAKNMVYVSIGGVLLLSLITIYLGNKNNKGLESSQSIFNALLPLVGAWVGTILAYYFSKENFESANRNVRDMVGKLTTMEKLMSIPLKSKMIPNEKGEIELLKITHDKLEDKINLKQDILDKFNRNRIPVLNENDHPQYLIHRSMIDKYLTKRAFELNQAEKLSGLTLKDLLEDPESKGRFDFGRGFMTVKEDGTLADAKREMDKAKECSDVFVTKNGTKDEPIIGWITNLIITENATV